MHPIHHLFVISPKGVFMNTLHRLLPAFALCSFATFSVAATTASGVSSTSSVVDTTAASIAKGLPTGVNGNKASIGKFDPIELNNKLVEGLLIWRKPRVDLNGISKGACASCHSSDGLELAVWDFHDDDVRRRAHIDGTSAAEREALVSYFAALRQKYKITTVKSILNDRPLQPRGTPFPGATKAERDYIFALNSLQIHAPTLYNGEFNTIAQAIQAKNELKASNPMNMRIGIPFPRISEDCFRGAEHCTANDWIADTPRVPKFGREAEWFQINDAYIANPTDANLRAVLIAVDTLTDPWRNPGESNPGPAATLGTEKFKSVQILQHLLRRQLLGLYNPATGPNPLTGLAALTLKRPNFPFLVGDFSFDKDGPTWKNPSDMPSFVRTSLGETSSTPLTNTSIEEFKAQMATPWWYAGFVLNANLGTGTNTEYFFGSLAIDRVGGYPFHRFYATSKHGAIVNDRKASPAQTDAFNLAIAKPGWKEVGSDDLSRLYVNVQARQLYRRLEMSWTLMWMQLMKAQIQQSGLSSLSKDFDIDKNLCAATGSVSLRQWVSTVSGLDATRAQQAFNLYNELNAMANCGLPALPSSYLVGTGTGLTVTWYKGSGDEWNGKSAWLTGSPKMGSRVEPIVYFPGREDGQGYFAAWTRSIGVDVTEDAKQAFSSRGTGFIQVPITGTYEFDLRGGFGKMFVADKEVYNEFRYNEGTPLRATVVLQAGQRYSFVYERHGFAPGGVQITWRSVDANIPRQKIPTTQFYPN
jgi:hypothetical protein